MSELQPPAASQLAPDPDQTDDPAAGEAATLDETGTPKMRPSDWATYRRLLGYVKPHWFFFLLAVIGFQLGAGAEAYFARMFGDLRERLHERSPPTRRVLLTSGWIGRRVRASTNGDNDSRVQVAHLDLA